jgi:branched-chain amino acid aminotransferase
MSLRILAAELGLKVEERDIMVEELKDFEEGGACGTAAVISPISEIQDRETGEIYKFASGDKEAGPWCQKLYERLLGIQYGEYPDNHNWCLEIEC